MSGNKTAGLPRQDRAWATAAEWFADGQRIGYDPGSAGVHPGSHLSIASISQMIPKPIRSASFGHAGTHRAVATFSVDIAALLNLARTRLVSLIPTMSADTRRAQGLPPPPSRALRHYPPRVSDGRLNSSGPQTPGPEEVAAMMFWYGAHWAFWEVALMWVGMIAFWGLLIWAVYALVVTATRKPGQEHRGEDALRILDQRLARGEIDAEEYQRPRDLIGSGRSDSRAGAGGRR
jgi:putative membrane protein